MGTSAGEGGKHVRTVRLRTLYDCASMCGRTRTNAGDMDARAACRCSLLDFDPARWDPDVDPYAAAEAESKLQELQAIAHHQRVDLEHDLDVDGCPWGWVVSGYATSVARYMGSRTVESSARTPSAWMLARIAQPGEMPTRLLEAVDMAQAHEDNAFAFYHRTVHKSG